MRRLIFIGIESQRSEAINGEVVKNQLLLTRLREIYDEVNVIDLYDLKKRVFPIAVRFLYTLIRYPKTKIILSASTKVAFRFVKFFNLIKRAGVYYWVVGGAFGDLLSKGEYPVEPYGVLKRIMVQGNRMVNQLRELGLTQTERVLNVKPIDYIPPKTLKADNDRLDFVFLSRVSPSKGCDEIFEAVQKLNEEKYQDRFSVSFFGKIEDGYDSFLASVDKYDNVEYKGFIDLQDTRNYDVLAKYDVMLFPSFWEGEGFAGIFIDAFIAGLPVICSDWNCNSEFINDEVGIVVPTHDVNALTEAMKSCIERKVNLPNLIKNCQNRAMEYDINRALSEEFLKSIDLLD